MSDNEDLDDEEEPADDDKEFLKLLDSELDKVTHFYVSKVNPSAPTFDRHAVHHASNGGNQLQSFCRVPGVALNRRSAETDQHE